MATQVYCWRTKKIVPMLNEDEWNVLSPYLVEAIEEIKRHRQAYGTTLAESKPAGFGKDALDCYFKLTGYLETNPDNLWHYRASGYGPPCTVCAKPLRTTRAKLCAECGAIAQPTIPADACRRR